MAIMSMEIYEDTMRRLAMYQDIEISERQIENGQIKDAKTALESRKAILDSLVGVVPDDGKTLEEYRGERRKERYMKDFE